jgi:hypothetical protein
MISLYTESQFNIAKSTDKLPCKCEYCNQTFYKYKKYINFELKQNKGEVKYCSAICNKLAKNKSQTVSCLNCNIKFTKSPNQIKSSPNHFCTKSCSASYNNKHKTTGTRRSKLEIYLEEQLSLLYPNIEFHFNRKDKINSELDIYIPTLKLAFELNGIFHYEPIYGSDKLNQIQNNDNRKFQACLEQGIELCIIDTSGLKYFKPTNAQKYLDIIVNIINQRTSLLTS